MSHRGTQAARLGTEYSCTLSHKDQDILTLMCLHAVDEKGLKVKMFDLIFVVTSFYSINVSCTNIEMYLLRINYSLCSIVCGVRQCYLTLQRLWCSQQQLWTNQPHSSVRRTTPCVACLSAMLQGTGNLTEQFTPIVGGVMQKWPKS